VGGEGAGKTIATVAWYPIAGRPAKQGTLAPRCRRYVASRTNRSPIPRSISKVFW
jgi:hypothetical protein